MTEAQYWVQIGMTALVAFMASSGFWALMTKVADKKDKSLKLLLGLAHDRIISLGSAYVERGWITHDEYEDFIKYLYGPYATFGGNGLAERVAAQIQNLPMSRKPPPGWPVDPSYDPRNKSLNTDGDIHVRFNPTPARSADEHYGD